MCSSDPPRRAGISSLGVGGTNAHVVIEEAPPAVATPAARPEQLLALSAVDEATLAETTSRLADALEVDPDTNLADVAHTLATGRRAMTHRRVVAATDLAGAVDVLRSRDRNRVATSVASDDPLQVAFLFPGGGAQYAGMAAGLDDRFDVFHEVMADGIERVRERCGVDLAPLLRPDASGEALRKTTVSLPAVFLTSVALARQWMAWGVIPGAFVGHSLGEYTAAHLAGVLTMDGALDLIIARASLIDRVSGVGAAMLAVPLPVSEVRPLLPPSLSVATVNADDECVIAGLVEDIELLAEKVATDEIQPTLIPVAAAGHSSVLDPILPEFLEAVSHVPLAPPQVPYLSNLTGTWITDEQATDPQYWVDHLRQTVRFSDCLSAVLANGPLVALEMGPGHSLSSYARRQRLKPAAAIPTLRHPNQEIDDTAYSLLAVGRAWAAGIDVDLARFAGSDRRRLRLPGYPFRRERHWIEPGEGRRVAAATPVAATGVEAQRPALRRITELADEFWAPGWVEAAPSPPVAEPAGPWLVVGSPDDLFVSELAGALRARDAEVAVAETLEPEELSGARSIVLVGPTAGFDAAAERWMTTGSAAARALGSEADTPVLLAAVTRGATDAGGLPTAPLDAMAFGIVRTAPREYLGMRTALVDLDPAGGDAVQFATDAASVVTELFEGSDRVVAHRGARRLVPLVERQRVGSPADAETAFRSGGAYLVTGGLGDVGFAIATRLASSHGADLAIVTSQPVPEGRERHAWLAGHGPDDATSRRILRLAELESLGTKVVALSADLADPESVEDLLDRAEEHVGPIDGVVHAAGGLRDRPIELATAEDHEVVLGAKARGAAALVDELGRRSTDLLVLISSTSTVLAPEGQASYVAANSVLDSLAGDHGDLRVRTIDYGLWRETGVTAMRRSRLGLEPGVPVSHPVLSEMAVDRDGTVHLVGRLTCGHHWVVDEHRTADGIALLPGTGHLELFLAASELAGEGAAIGSVTLLDPLLVPDEASVAVRVTLAPADDDGRRWARLESDGGASSWRLHSEAQLVPVDDGEAVAAPVPRRSESAVDVDVLDRPAALMQFGPRWDAVSVAWKDGDEVSGRLELSEPYRSELEHWYAHPALVDVATAFGMVLGGDDDRLYVPIGYDIVTRRGALPGAPWVRARRHGSSSPDLLRLDITLGDDDGNVLLAIEGLTLRPVSDSDVLGHGRADEPSPAEKGHRVPPLLTVAEQLGIEADEGAEMLEAFLASGRSRLLASSIDLDDLAAIVEPTAPARSEPPGDDGEETSSLGDSVLSTIREIWVELLGVSDIGVDDDFFDVGGHSLIAIRMMSRIHKDLGVRFQLATIFDAPTIAMLSAEVRKVRPELDDQLAGAAAGNTIGRTEPASAPHRSLVPISTTGDEPPIFVVHGAGGNVLFLWTLARALAGSRPVYGFQAHGIDGSDMPDPTIEAMAERYVEELRAAHDGPYLIGGYSGGGLVAFEMTRQLQALGERVDRLVFFDSPLPGETKLPLRTQCYELLRNTRRYGVRRIKPYLRWRTRLIAHRYLPFLVRKAGRDAELVHAARQIGAIDVEDAGFVDLFYYFSAAADRYQVRPLDVDAVLVKADWVWPVHAFDYHWSRFITGRLDVVGTPGDHWAMFFPENAPQLAEALVPLLEQQ